MHLNELVLNTVIYNNGTIKIINNGDVNNYWCDDGSTN
ncbi:hypothetical protein Vdis_1774 [Vulcanisaeta distributa DSM 14429]|uniref:Uncharacterized protein n=1 Tax=Vulcanisaeta distributa (strain DSM 14429 / JCM 11212 / NBRC 100878 / IC-017) TaxID=572478 RepID=E1QUM9_VULDI|nr:hypothetical protein Vdis_1774 [Vulcanisaeta distributa DSM 14429]